MRSRNRYCGGKSNKYGIFWTCVCLILSSAACLALPYRGVDKSLARPGRKQATATKLQILQAKKKKSESYPSNQISGVAMSSASDEKLRPFDCFFSRVGLRTYQHPVFFNIISRHDFRREKGKLLNTNLVSWFSLKLFSGTFLILRRIQRDIFINVVGLHVKYPLLLYAYFNKIWISAKGFSKNTQIPNFI